MENKIKKIMNIIEVSEYGFCTLEKSEDYIKKTKSIIEKKFNCSFIPDDFLDNMDPTTYMKNAQNMIVIALPYSKNNLKLNKDSTSFSSSSWGEDYHVVIKNKLQIFIQYMEEIYPLEDFLPLVDNHKLDERYYAHKCNIGYYGKNGLLINDEYGTTFFIGMVLTSLKIVDDKLNENNKKCFGCDKCINMCPSKAITKDGVNYNKCVSYLTQKKELTKVEEGYIKDLVYGCDVCSTVCPHNKTNVYLDSFCYDKNVEFNLNEEFKYSNSTFKLKYGKYSGSWRGKKIIERNLNLIRENRCKK